jgi:hypothetical protein
MSEMNLIATLKGRGQRFLARGARSIAREELPSHPDVRHYLEFGSPERLSLPTPAAVETSNPQWLRDNLALWKPSWPAPFVCIVQNARLLGSLYLGVTTRGEIILETTRTAGSRDLLWPKITRHTIRNRAALATTNPPVLSADPLAPLFHVSQDSYFHWFCDVLPVIEAVRQLEAATGTRARFLVSRPLQTWQRDTLALLGVSEADIICWDGSCAAVPQLVVASVRTDGWTCLPSINALRWLRDELMRAALPDVPTSPFLYIQRRNRRRIRNEDEVDAFMASRGIVPIDLDGLPIVEQMQRFKHARLVVGTHGAGLTNLIFSQAAQVVELFGPWKSLCYAAIAGGLGHGYAGVDLMPAVGFQKGAVGIVDDFDVDLRRRQPVIDSALERTPS